MLAYIEDRISEENFVRADIAMRMGQNMDDQMLSAMTDAILECS